VAKKRSKEPDTFLFAQGHEGLLGHSEQYKKKAPARADNGRAKKRRRGKERKKN